MITIYLMNGPEKGKSFESASNTVSIGRVADNDVQLKEQSISRNHLIIRKKGTDCFVKDLSSTNGTFIAGKLISPALEVPVEEGTPIKVGKLIISIGKACSEESITLKPVEKLTDVFSETARFTVYKDRPQTTLKNMELIHKFSNVLIQSRDINEIMEQMLDYIFELLIRIDRGVIILIDEESKEKIIEVISRPKMTPDMAEPLFSRSIVNRVRREGKPLIMLDTYGHHDEDMSRSMEIMKVRSVMCVPLMSKSTIRGVIYVDTVKIPYGFRKEDLSLLISLSGPAAIAIENALIYSKLEKIVEERTENLKGTEERLRESEARFKAIFNNMSSGVTVYRAVNGGEDFIITDMNRANRKIEQIKSKDVIGASIFQQFPEVSSTELPAIFKKVWQRGKPERRTVVIPKNPANTSWREYYIYRLPTKEIVAIFDDITSRKKAEEEQKTLQRQLFESQKMETIGAFAGGTAHNFRNILQAISGNMEYLEMIYGDNSEIKSVANDVNNSIDRGVELINNLLHFSKRGGKLDLEVLDLSDVILNTYEIVARLFHKDIEIKVDIEKKLMVNGNRSLLSQVFMNLLTNARDAMSYGGTLTIQSRRMKNKIIATVSDTGIGMEKEVQEKIFDPFFTLKEVGKGTGLGLSTSLGIIEEHNGSITVSSEPDKGALFKIQLPIAKQKEIEKIHQNGEIISGNGQKVLIVDDERVVLDSLSYLTQRLGYEPIPMDNPLEAMEKYEKLAPDAVLMDRSMPGIDGTTCIKNIIKIDPNAKIIIVSGYNESGPNGIKDDIRGLIKGYITKPCDAEQLSRALSDVLENDDSSR